MTSPFQFLSKENKRQGNMLFLTFQSLKLSRQIFTMNLNIENVER